MRFGPATVNGSTEWLTSGGSSAIPKFRVSSFLSTTRRSVLSMSAVNTAAMYASG